MSEKADAAIKRVRKVIADEKNRLTDRTDYEKFVEEIGSDFDGDWDAIKEERSAEDGDADEKE